MDSFVGAAQSLFDENGVAESDSRVVDGAGIPLRVRTDIEEGTVCPNLKISSEEKPEGASMNPSPSTSFDEGPL